MDLDPEEENKCHLPVHATCGGLTRNEEIQLKNPKRKIIFHCDICTSSGKSDLEAIKSMIESMTKRFDAIHEKYEAAIFDNDELIELSIKEINQRNKRARNIILYNVEEYVSTNNVEKQQNDSDSVRKPIVDKCRPLKLILPSTDVAFTLLKDINAHNAHKNSSNKISAYRDRTIRERAYLRKLRDVLDNRRKQGEQNLTIRYIDARPTIKN
ncbi:hypothetical protein O3M35_008700 [Rhynocoris fuscipes]|uniref:Uncharacterized protein n=1 Tax=Rhynocoris fuscipes TaxID=488301 RepID=A0AAW1DCF5_9HEMI